MTSESSICTKLTSLTYVIGSWPNFQTGSSSPVECGLAMAESLMWLKASTHAHIHSPVGHQLMEMYKLDVQMAELTAQLRQVCSQLHHGSRAKVWRAVH
ncbi:hypothetical protein ABBQ32_012962 [Trebouxia sp. C0010 RCD-2024]